MNPGELRHKIAIQQIVKTQDSYGQPTEDWQDVIPSTWASVEPLVGKQYFAAETINSEVTHKVKMRYRPGITPDMSVKFGDRRFNIITPINYQERNIELQLMCREIL